MSHTIGLQLLKLLPVVFSTVNLQWARDEHELVSAWVETGQAHRVETESVLAPWMASWLSRAQWQAIIGLPLPLLAGVLVHFQLRPQSAASFFRDPLMLSLETSTASAARWYLAGTFYTMAHYFFAKKAMRLLGEMSGKDFVSGMTIETCGKGLESTAEWLKMHQLRTIVADVPAFVCFVTATVKAIS